MPLPAGGSRRTPPPLPWLLLRAGHVWWKETVPGSCGRKAKHRGAKSPGTGRGSPAVPRASRGRGAGPGRRSVAAGRRGPCSSGPAVAAAPLQRKARGPAREGRGSPETPVISCEEVCRHLAPWPPPHAAARDPRGSGGGAVCPLGGLGVAGSARLSQGRVGHGFRGAAGHCPDSQAQE